MSENLRKNHPSASAALAKVFEMVEDEGYSEGWDAAFDIGYQSGGHHAAHVFVEALCKANDLYTAETYDIKGDGKSQNEDFDRTVGRFLAILEDALPFKVDWTEVTPIFPEDENEEEQSDD